MQCSRSDSSQAFQIPRRARRTTLSHLPCGDLPAWGGDSGQAGGPIEAQSDTVGHSQTRDGGSSECETLGLRATGNAKERGGRARRFLDGHHARLKGELRFGRQGSTVGCTVGGDLEGGTSPHTQVLHGPRAPMPDTVARKMNR